MKFKSRKDIIFGSVFLVLPIILIGITLYAFFWSERGVPWWGLILVFIICTSFMWFFFSIRYELSDDSLIYRHTLIHRKISVYRIKEIVVGKMLFVATGPATAGHGLIIKYDDYNMLYISPKTNETFIKKILELNNDIKIKVFPEAS